jgi:hypothetical protein
MMDFKGEWQKLYTRMKFEDQVDSCIHSGCLIVIGLVLAFFAWVMISAIFDV